MPLPPDVDQAALRRFFAPAPEDVRAQLRAALAYLREVSRGEVRNAEPSPAPHKPYRGSLECGALFGPFEDDTCLCGQVTGEPARRGESCPRCGAPIGPASLRAELWAHIDLAAPLVHPRALAEVAAALGISTAAARGILDLDVLVDDAGELTTDDDAVYAIERTGAAGLRALAALRGVDERALGLVDAIPVPPPASRRSRPPRFPAKGRWGGRAPAVRSREDLALAELLARNSRVRRLRELKAPAIILANEVRGLQQAFDAAVTAIGDADDGPRELWRDALNLSAAETLGAWFSGAARRPGATEPLRLDPPPSAFADANVSIDDDLPPTQPRALGFIGDDRLLVQFAYATLVVDVDDGRILWRGPATPYRLVGVAGERALFSDRYGRERVDDRLAGAAALDLATCAWLDHLPPDLPAVFVEKDQPEDAWLVDWRRLLVADVAEDRSGDRCHEIARTPDHRFLWTSSSPEDGAVLCTATAECQLLLSTMGLEHAQARTLTERGLVGPAQDGDERLEGPPPEGWRDEPEPDAMAAVAIARAADAELWTILDAWCGVSVDGELRFRLPLIPAASAFSADARRLAAATAGQLVVVDVERPALLRRYDLRPLAATLAPPRPAGLDEALWSRLLVDFGGAEAIAAADDAALLARRGIGPAKLRALRILSYETAPQRLVERLSTD